MSNVITFKQVAEPFFGIDCPRLRRLERGGRKFSPKYIKAQRKIVVERILADDELGEIEAKELNSYDIDMFSDRVVARYGYGKKSRDVTVALKIVLGELGRQRKVDVSLANLVTPISYKEKVRGILTSEEIAELFKPQYFNSLFERAFFIIAFSCGLIDVARY